MTQLITMVNNTSPRGLNTEIVLVCKDMDGRVPEEIQVIPYGYHETPKGPFLSEESSAREIIEKFNAMTNDMVIDYEHQTLDGVEAPAAGWIKSLIDKGAEGIWAVVEWNKRAKTYIENREYRYVSPVFFKTIKENRVVALLNVALTNQPNIDGMVPIVNKTGSNKPKKEERRMKELLKLLGLSEEATEEAAIVAVNKLIEAGKGDEVVANKAVIDALGLKEGATEPEITGTIVAMKQSHGQTGDLSKQVANLSDKLARRDAADLVANAMKEGKVTPAQKEWADKYATSDPEGFKVFVGKAPVVIETKDLSGGGGPGKGGGVDETTLVVAKQFGNSEEDLKKYGGLQ